MGISHYIYSDSLDEMVVKSFFYKKKHYTWNDFDCIYYEDDSEEDYLSDIPAGAIFDNL